jgi:hypothetical protein
VKAADAARVSLDQIARELDALNKRVDVAVAAVANAQNAADRTAATDRLKQLQVEHTELLRRIGAAKDAAAKAERAKGVKVSPECLDNPLAKGC